MIWTNFLVGNGLFILSELVSSSIVIIVSFILLPFLFSRTAKSPGGAAAGTAHRTTPGTTTLVASPTPKAESE